MEFGTIKIFLAGIPETVGLLGFGIGLVVLAVLIRRIIGGGEAGARKERVTKKA